MANSYGLKNLIGNSSDQFKSDFINKINQALKKLDGVGYSSPASVTGESVGMSVASPKKTGATAATTPDISDVAYAMEAPKAKKKKEEKIEKILGNKSIYADIVKEKAKSQRIKEEQKDEKTLNEDRKQKAKWFKNTDDTVYKRPTNIDLEKIEENTKKYIEERKNNESDSNDSYLEKYYKEKNFGKDYQKRIDKLQGIMDNLSDDERFWLDQLLDNLIEDYLDSVNEEKKNDSLYV